MSTTPITKEELMELVEKETNRTSKGVVFQHFDELQKLRDLGVGYESISEFLKTKGVDISPKHIATYMSQIKKLKKARSVVTIETVAVRINNKGKQTTKPKATKPQPAKPVDTPNPEPKGAKQPEPKNDETVISDRTGKNEFSAPEPGQKPTYTQEQLISMKGIGERKSSNKPIKGE